MREEKEQENANLIRQALSKLHESVKDKVSRSELKLLRETLEKTRNMEVRFFSPPRFFETDGSQIKSLDPKHSKPGDESRFVSTFFHTPFFLFSHIQAV